MNRMVVLALLAAALLAAGCSGDSPRREATTDPTPAAPAACRMGAPAPAGRRYRRGTFLRHAAVDFYAIEGGGHTWPGSSYDLAVRGLGATTPDLKATKTLWAFFRRHRVGAP